MDTLTHQPPKYILPLIVVSQFAGTSVWFVGNAILPDIQRQMNLDSNALGNITSIVQFGFIAGTFIFALLALVDRFAPSKVFFVCSLLAALANVCVVWLAHDAFTLMLFRFLTGVFLAGIYPVGMKIAADWYEQSLGKSLGLLLGALVLGTAFPHLLKSNAWHLPWKEVIYATSIVCLAGGLCMLLLVPPGPYRKKGSAFHPRDLVYAFRSKDFSAAAIGYFGHMWELYAWWAFIPVLLQLHQQQAGAAHNVSLWSFIIIATGSIGCIAGGYISRRIGSAKVAFYALLGSGICCCISWLLIPAPEYLFIIFVLIWGFTISADSPQFSTLVAQTAPPATKGTALTFVVCIGFAITIAGIQCLGYVIHHHSGLFPFLALAPGPLIGVSVFYRLIKKMA